MMGEVAVRMLSSGTRRMRGKLELQSTKPRTLARWVLLREMFAFEDARYRAASTGLVPGRPQSVHLCDRKLHLVLFPEFRVDPQKPSLRIRAPLIAQSVKLPGMKRPTREYLTGQRRGAEDAVVTLMASSVGTSWHRLRHAISATRAATRYLERIVAWHRAYLHAKPVVRGYEDQVSRALQKLEPRELPV